MDTRGWKAIAEVVGTSIAMARARALRRRDPMPVLVDHRGIGAERAELLAWAERNPALAAEALSGTVYAFLDRKGIVRYVGQTRRPLGERVAEHLLASQTASSAFQWWLAWYLDRYGDEPRVIVLERTEDRATLDRLERAWIERHASTILNFASMPKAVAS